MLQFRASLVLKELIQTSPKRLLSDITRHKKTLPNAYLYGVAYPDGRVSKLKTVCNGRAFIQPLAGKRFLCTKTEGAIDTTEPVKKDESVQEATADKYDIYLFILSFDQDSEVFGVIDRKYTACVQHTRQNITEWLTTWRCVYTFIASGWRTCVVVKL